MGLFDKLKQGLTKTRQNMGSALAGLFGGFTRENLEFFDDLEEMLIMADLGVETASRTVESLKERCKSDNLRTPDEVLAVLREILISLMDVGDTALKIGTKPSVMLVIGVNGVGKTTTLGKLAQKFAQEGHDVLLCAGDTFRAAAAEQLGIWADRAHVDIIRQQEGADPAAVVFDALTAAKKRGSDIVLCDTAGRLHNKKNLMNELNKISRVIEREAPGCDRENLLVLDATTGQNGLMQAAAFAESVPLTGVILTKLDGTAKGGIVCAVADTLKIPVKYVGVGEQIDDLLPFDARAFVEALTSVTAG